MNAKREKKNDWLEVGETTWEYEVRKIPLRRYLNFDLRNYKELPIQSSRKRVSEAARDASIWRVN